MPRPRGWGRSAEDLRTGEMAPDAPDPFANVDPEATGAGLPIRTAAPREEDTGDTDATRPAVPVSPADSDATQKEFGLPPDDPGATRLGFTTPPADQDATRLGVGPLGSPADPEQTQSGQPASVFTRLAASRVDSRPDTGPGTRPGTGGSGYARPAGESAADLVGHPLGTRYQILKLLGVGGMGAVYEAWDQELEVVVALKTVRPEVAADAESAHMLERRFKQELLLARQVTHKNIVRVHDMGEVDGLKYITMPYLKGEDLATVLKREGKLAVSRVMLIARQVASGLSAAHDVGVVHRDLKPANIMMQADGEALVMDFGVARSTGGPKSLPPSGPDGRVTVERSADQTMVGSVVGTIEYMAPEQARAQPVDQRADIYAFGLILYDLLLGRTRASRTDSVIAELNLRMKEPPPSARSIDPTIPEALDRIITRCVQTDADARYATTADLVAEFDTLDENGEPLPILRRLTWRIGTVAAILVVSLLGVTWWLARGPEAPVQHAPVSVLIADFQNGTGDPSFDRTLEPVLKLAMEGAGFISAYDRTAIRSNLGVRPPDKMDERAAQQIAVRQGLNVVLSGSVDRQGNRYTVSVKATQAVTGNVITEPDDRASSKDQVLSVATNLAARVRKALGDTTTSGSSQLFAMETLSATSLDVVHDYAAAMDALSNSRFEEALRGFSKTVARDPNFGLGYAGMAVASRNLDRQQDAQRYMQEAVRHLDGMTERERLRTRGLSFKWSGDYQACVKEFGDLIARYSADAMARNNLAGCLSNLRDQPKAIEEMRQAVKILPKRNLYRENLALYAAYNSDFQTAEREARAIETPGLFGVLPLAFAQVLQGQMPQATETYQRLATIDEQGASYTASGLGDLALYEGRFADAERILEQGATADLAAKNPDRAAAKFAALGYARVLRGTKGPAIAAAEKALANSKAVKIRFLTARVFVEAGDMARAKALAAGLAAELQAEPQAYAKIVDGEAALKSGDARQAIKTLTEANTLFDTWMGHFDLGRAHLEAGAFLSADSEFDRCIKRRGEALALFLDEEPTYGFFPSVYYYQGRVREGLNNKGFAESYRTYLEIRGKSTEDPLLPEVRRRAGR
jgi:eukaryotic-like serine/threonine-protein kinase